MKKNATIATLLLLTMTILSACGSPAPSAAGTTDSQSVVPKDSKTEQTGKSDLITEEEAKKIALEHAGIAEGDITFAKVGLDTDDGIQEYEVEFYTQDTEYDYSINAQNGEIRSYDNEIENRMATAPDDSSPVSLEDAKKLALEKVPGATDGNLRIKEDKDDGRSVFEGTILYENQEYDFEIDASTGKFTEWDVEKD